MWGGGGGTSQNPSCRPLADTWRRWHLYRKRHGLEFMDSIRADKGFIRSAPVHFFAYGTEESLSLWELGENCGVVEEGEF